MTDYPALADYVTCPMCQADLMAAKEDFETREDWPLWLDLGFCCPECRSKHERQEAEATLHPFVRKHLQFRGVRYADALRILRAERYDEMMADPIRGKGPVRGLIYPWNVVDYMLKRSSTDA